MEPLISRNKRAKRIKRSFVARFRLLKPNFVDPAKWNIVTMKNLSSTGVFFSHNEEIPVGTAIELNISLPFVNSPAHCVGKVCRVDRDRYKAELRKIPLYGIAAHFEIINDEIKKAIDNYAEKLSSE